MIKYHKPFYNTNREYENRINEFRVYDGYTVPKLSKMVGMSTGYLYELAQGMVNPFNREGELKDFIIRLCNIFNVEFAELFPFEACFIDFDINAPKLVNDQINNITLSRYTMTAHTYEDLDLSKTMMNVLNTLPNQLKDVIIGRFYYEMTLDDVGEILGLGRERVRQKEHKALRTLRHYTRSNKLRMFINEDYISREFHRLFDEIKYDVEEE